MATAHLLGDYNEALNFFIGQLDLMSLDQTLSQNCNISELSCAGMEDLAVTAAVPVTVEVMAAVKKVVGGTIGPKDADVAAGTEEVLAVVAVNSVPPDLLNNGGYPTSVWEMFTREVQQYVNQLQDTPPLVLRCEMSVKLILPRNLLLLSVFVLRLSLTTLL
jgi:hypothetical protein